jgi:hypothetical protein
LEAEASDSEMWYVGDPTLDEISADLGGSVERK